MVLARIKANRLQGWDYIKFSYGQTTGHYPRITRKWGKVPLDAAYFIEATKHPDFEVSYEVDEVPYAKAEKANVEADKEIDEMLGVTPQVEEKKEEKIITKKKK